MKFDNVAEILDHRFVGNHASDYPAFCAIEDFLGRPDVTLDDKLKASEHQAVRGMGLDYSEREAKSFINDCMARTRLTEKNPNPRARR